MRDFMDQRSDHYYPKAGSGLFVLLAGILVGSACTLVWLGIAHLIFG